MRNLKQLSYALLVGIFLFSCATDNIDNDNLNNDTSQQVQVQMDDAVQEVKEDNSSSGGNSDSGNSGGDNSDNGSSGGDNSGNDNSDSNANDSGNSTTIDVNKSVFRKNLVEEYTATWCPNCAAAIAVTNAADKSVFVPVSIHVQSSGLENSNSIKLAKSNGVSSRTVIYVNQKFHNLNSPITKSNYSQNAQIAIAIATTVQGNTVKVTPQFRFYKNATDFKYAVYLLQDGIRHNQAGTREGANFIHNHVLKNVQLPRGISANLTVAGKTLQTTATLDKAGVPDSVGSIVVVAYSSTGVENTQIVKLGASIGFHNEL